MMGFRCHGNCKLSFLNKNPGEVDSLSTPAKSTPAPAVLKLGSKHPNVKPLSSKPKP